MTRGAASGRLVTGESIGPSPSTSLGFLASLAHEDDRAERLVGIAG
jgi:hypothetical protein